MIEDANEKLGAIADEIIAGIDKKNSIFIKCRGRLKKIDKLKHRRCELL